MTEGFRFSVLACMNKRKNNIIEILGQACISCGYDKNLEILRIVHRPNETKLFNMNIRNIDSYSWDRVFDECMKCDLLCPNCDAEKKASRSHS